MYLQQESYAGAAKYLSLAAHIDPYSHTVLENLKDLQAAVPKLKLCKWRGNIFTKHHEETTSIGIFHANSQISQDSEGLVFFFHSALAQNHKHSHRAYHNVGISLYRRAMQLRGVSSHEYLYNRLMGMSLKALMRFESKLHESNQGLLSFVKKWARQKFKSLKKASRKLAPPRVALCGQSVLYSAEQYHFIDGMLMLRAERLPEALVLLNASYHITAKGENSSHPKGDDVTVAAIANCLFLMGRIDEAMEWAQRVHNRLLQKDLLKALAGGKDDSEPDGRCQCQNHPLTPSTSMHFHSPTTSPTSKFLSPFLKSFFFADCTHTCPGGFAKCQRAHTIHTHPTYIHTYARTYHACTRTHTILCRRL